MESISESIPDGGSSPLFWFAFFGIPAALVFRAINTLDSMIGYKDPEHINIGWFSAKLDTVVNYIPARLTTLIMILSAIILKEDWKNTWRILKRDKHKTESLNSGWPMAAMAGALRVQLEKLDTPKKKGYKLGEPYNSLSSEHIYRAMRMMKVTIFLFVILVIFPILFFLNVIIGFGGI